MAQHATSFVEEVVEESRERLNAARSRIDAEVTRARRELAVRRRRLERVIEKNRRTLEKQARRQVKVLEGNPLVQRIEALGSQATRRIEGVVESVLGTFQIASRSELRKLDRKLSKLGKRLDEIEHARHGNGRHHPHTTPHPHSS